jgi:O-antigen ligase
MSVTAIIYLFIYFFGLFKAITDKPVYGLYVYFVAFYMHAPSRWWGKSLPDIRWSFIAGIITLIAIYLKNNNADIKYLDYKQNKYFLIFFVYVTIQLMWAINYDLQLEYVVLLIKFLILIFIIQNSIKTTEDLERVIIVNILGCAYIGYLGLTQHTGGRLEGIGTPGLESANQLGQHLAAVFMFSAYFLLKNMKPKMLFLWPFVGLNLMAIFMTESRGVLISLAVTGLFALFVIPPRIKSKFFIYYLLGIVAASSLLGPQIIERFSTMQVVETSDTTDKSAASRMVIIKAQFEMFKERALFGHGHRGTLLLSREHIPEEYLTKSTNRRASHNLFMTMLVDHGVIGFLLYFYVIWLCIKTVFLARKKLLRDNDQHNYLLVLQTGFVLSLFLFMFSGLGSNNKKLETDIWLIAIIPLIYEWYNKFEQRKNNVDRQ